MNFRFLRADINTTIIPEKAPKSHQIKRWSKFGGKKREYSYYPYAKTEETSVGTGDKPLLTTYSNISEKHFTYGNTCLNLGGFTLRTHFLYKLKTESQERKKVLQGLQLPSLLLVCSFTSGRLPLHCWLLLEKDWRSQAQQAAAEASNSNSDMTISQSTVKATRTWWLEGLATDNSPKIPLFRCARVNLFLCNAPSPWWHKKEYKATACRGHL